MSKDEMKNKISMALKDPILQQGFEIVCKENAELKETVTKMNNVITETFSNLTKAKELLKILLKYDRGQFFEERRIYEKYMSTRDEAEQFLQEVDE